MIVHVSFSASGFVKNELKLKIATVVLSAGKGTP